MEFAVVIDARIAGAIRVGVAGWDYPDWEGVVYPRARIRVDRLAYLARFVGVVEINSTFYRPAAPRSAARWAAVAAGGTGVRFTAKAHRSWTHEPVDDPDQAVRSTLEGLAPLREAGVLTAVLVQFPQRFHAGPEAFDRLLRLADRVRGWPVAVEVRHASWGSVEARHVVVRCGFAWCVVDQPRIGGATLQVEPVATAPLAYLRLHGRNAHEWFRADAGRDARYDYLYDRSELHELNGVARALAERCKQVVVVHNNHFRGQAVVNALQMKASLQPGRQVAPGTLIRAYPALAEVADPDEPALF